MDASEDVSHARYDFLATSLTGALASSGGLSLVVRDSSLNSGTLRDAIESIHKNLLVFELPCMQARVCAQIITNLPRLLASNLSDAALGARNGGKAIALPDPRRFPVLFVCDDADSLDDDQLEAMYRLASGEHGPLGVILLASPKFLLRLQLPHLQHLKGALAACLWSQRSSYGGRIAAAARQGADGSFDDEAFPAITDHEELDMHEVEPAINLPPQSLPPRGAESAPTGVVAPPKMRKRTRSAALFLVLLAFASVEVLIVYIGWSGGFSLMTASATNVPVSTQQSRAGDQASESAAPQIAESLAALQASAPARETADAMPAPREPEPGHLSQSAAAADVAPAAGDIPPRKPEPALQAANDSRAQTLTPVVATDARGGPPAESERNAARRDGAAAVGTNAKLSAADIASFVARGNALLARGDIASARLFFERAADAGDSRAALGMAESYDPATLSAAGVQGVKGDPAKADFWYGQARLLATGPHPPLSQKENEP